MERYLARFDKDTCHWELLGTVDEQARQSFENSPAVLTVKELTVGGKWQGTVQELADEILERYPDTELPESAQGLRSYFAKVWPALKCAGIKHTTHRGAKQRTHTLSRAR